ncbi:1-phosphatidylinositol-4,5-bisphosphate phosphodiesterase 1 [Hysterangium stoloniferum]|nr:1-phosphatidylinositol-4,5-bisphosphate phosphodiesterase 1 [Hysterangium stoloniferum]
MDDSDFPSVSSPLSSVNEHAHALADHDDQPSLSSHGPPDTHSVDAVSTDDAADEVKVPALLLRGTPLLKVSAKKVQTRLFTLDPDQGQILWESKKSGGGVLPIEAIKEIRVAADTRSYRAQFKIAADAEPRWLTFIYMADGKYKTLHIIAPAADVFHMWVNTTRKLWEIRQELASSMRTKATGEGLKGVERREKAWERLYWKCADESGEERLEWKEVKKLCLRLNIHAPEADLFKRFTQADINKREYLDFQDFQRFVKLLKARSEVKRLYNTICAGGELDLNKFIQFMKGSQKSTLSDAELEKMFHRFALIPPQSPALPARRLPDISSVSLPLHSSDHTPNASPSPLRKNIPLPSDTLMSSSSPASSVFSHSPKSSSVPLPGSTPSSTSLSLAAFTSFLLSAENAPFTDVQHDMTRPLSEYYISSSHNTYLVGHQLVGMSTTEGYIRALLQGCRSVELDIYDGDSEPQIFHGKTLTSKVSVREVCLAIAKYAFVASPYPIVISAEIHCSLVQQDMVAEIMKEVFGTALITGPLEGQPIGADLDTLPSPEDLRGKVLLKAKNLNLVIDGRGNARETEKGVYETESSSMDESETAKAERLLKGLFCCAVYLFAELEQGLNIARHVFQRVRGQPPSPLSKPKPLPQTSNEPRPKVKMSAALAALLVYTVGVKCRGINKKEQYAAEHVFSLSEGTANKVLKANMFDLIKHNKTHVVRIYPKGLRLNSSNYEPHRYWAAGAQLVAINWQTFDLGYMINHTMFQQNGRTGYLLKPPPLRNADKVELSRRTEHYLDVTIISAQQLPRAKDKEGREILNKHIIDPFVEVSVLIPDWTHSPFGCESAATPASSPKPGASANATSPSSSTARTVTCRTGVVKNNGFNPVWEEALSLPFDCVGDMRDLIFVKFEVKEDGDDESGPIAGYCSSLGSLQEGYRHLPLHDQQLSQYLFSTLFVRIQVRDVPTKSLPNPTSKTK